MMIYMVENRDRRTKGLICDTVIWANKNCLKGWKILILKQDKKWGRPHWSHHPPHQAGRPQQSLAQALLLIFSDILCLMQPRHYWSTPIKIFWITTKLFIAHFSLFTITHIAPLTETPPTTHTTLTSLCLILCPVTMTGVPR